MVSPILWVFALWQEKIIPCNVKFQIGADRIWLCYHDHRKKKLQITCNCSEGTKLWWNWCEIHDHYISSFQRLHY